MSLSRITARSFALVLATFASTAAIDAQSFTGVEPANVAADGSTAVMLLGRGFPQDAAASIGGKAVERLRWVDASTLSGFAPALDAAEAPGPRDAAVDFGGRIGVITLRNAVTYFRPMTLGSIEPNEVSYIGGTPLTIRGSGFTERTIARLEDGTAIATRFVDAATLTAVAPPHAPTAAPLDLLIDDAVAGRAVLADALSYIGPLAITSIDPATVAADVPGPHRAAIIGVGFTPSTAVELIGPIPDTAVRAAAAVRWMSARRLEVDLPALAAGAYDVRVFVPSAAGAPIAAIARQALTVAASPLAIEEVSPREIPAAGGAGVEIRGARLDRGARIFFGAHEVLELKVVDGGARATGIAPPLPAGEPLGPRHVYAFDRHSAAVLQNGVIYVSGRDGDGDGDGVEGDAELCPLTPRGARPIAGGCSAMELLRAPERLVEPVLEDFELALAPLEIDPEVGDLAEPFREGLAGLDAALAGIHSGEIDRGVEAYGAALEDLSLALGALARGIDEAVARSRTPPPAEELIQNGDSDGNGRIEINDAIIILSWLFLGGDAPVAMRCAAGAPRLANGDTNGNGIIDIADAIYLLAWSFLGGPEPAPACGDAPSGDPAGADADASDSLLISLALKQASLLEAFEEARKAGEALGAAARSRLPARAIRGRVVEISDAQGTMRLDGGAIIALSRGRSYPTVSEGSSINARVVELGDGTGIAESFSDDTVDVDPYPGDLELTPCIDLRILPLQKFNVAYPSQLVRHVARGYEHDDGRLYLEAGMRLGAEYLFCTTLPYLDSNHYYSFSLKIDIEYRPLARTLTHQHVMVKKTLAEDLQDGDDPVELPANISPSHPATLTVIRRQRVCKVPILDFVDAQCTEWDESSTRTYSLIVHPRGHYAAATYNRSFFDFEDSPQDLSYRKVRVIATQAQDVEADVNGAAAFKAEGYKPVSTPQGEVSSRPQVQLVEMLQDFALHGRDLDFYVPKSARYVFSPSYDKNSGVVQPAGLRWPRIEGKHHGYPFRYSCTLPRVIHDGLAACNGNPSYYRLPFRKGLDGIKCGQGNFGGFTHQGGQAYAFDFGLPSGTEILAIRGGVIRLACNYNQGSCWDPVAKQCTCTSEPIEGSLCKLNTNSGNYIALQHEDGTYAWYAHIEKDSFNVNQWDYVRRGHPLALSDNVGCSTGAHLHFQVNGCDPVDCGHSSIASSYQVLSSLNGSVINCEVPVKDDDLYSNNEPWWE